MDLAAAICNNHSQLMTEMDFKFELDSKASSKKSASMKKSRRSGLSFNFSLSPRDGSSSGVPDSIDGSSKGTYSPPKTRRSGGWAGDTAKSAARRSSTAFFEQEQLDNKLEGGDDDDIPIIPNLDDYDDDEIARAPMVGHKVSSYKELELDLLKHSAFSSLDDVNFRVLTSFMQSAASLDEPDVVWTKDSLFTDLISYSNNTSTGE